LTEAAKAEIGRKADEPDHEDAGKDALGAKRLPSLQNHISHPDGRPDHLGGDDHDQGNAPGEAHPVKINGRLAGRTMPLKISISLAPREREERIRLISMLRAPAKVLRMTGKEAASAITKIFDPSPMPNQRMASGKREAEKSAAAARRAGQRNR
jgi:hypothetical protein